MRSPPSQVRI